MRQRKLIDLDERMADLADYIDRDGKQNKGRWSEMFSTKMVCEDAGSGKKNEGKEQGLLCLEIGCGKGKFIYEMAQEHPENCYIGIEGQESVIVRAAEKLKREPLPNVYLVSSYVRDLGDFFEEGELDRIYLNFSDPWPKARHAKRRLTYRDYLSAYMTALRPGGRIEFKTDNEGLFDFTLGEIDCLGYEICEMSRDMHGDGIGSVGFRTEYEEKFIAKGVKIKYVSIVK